MSLEDVVFKDSPFWTTHFFNSTDIVVRGLRVDNPSGLPHGKEPFVREWGFGPNSDGIDLEHSQRVLVEDCDIRCADDALCLKASRTSTIWVRANQARARVCILCMCR